MIKHVLGVLALMVLSGCAVPAAVTTPATLEDTWTGETDVNMLKLIRDDLATIKNFGLKKYILHIESPGGSPLFMSEIARELRDASNKGVIVEIHADMLCASACTLVLASGTPGYRYIQKNTVFLVHPLQVGDENGIQCVDHVADRTTVDGKITELELWLYRSQMSEFTGQSPETVLKWTTCGHETVGLGQVAVDMKIADHVE